MDLQLLKPPHTPYTVPEALHIWGRGRWPNKEDQGRQRINKPTQKPPIQTAKPVTKQNRTEDWERKKDDGQIIVALRLAQSVMVV